MFYCSYLGTWKSHQKPNCEQQGAERDGEHTAPPPLLPHAPNGSAGKEEALDELAERLEERDVLPAVDEEALIKLGVGNKVEEREEVAGTGVTGTELTTCVVEDALPSELAKDTVPEGPDEVPNKEEPKFTVPEALDDVP